MAQSMYQNGEAGPAWGVYGTLISKSKSFPQVIATLMAKVQTRMEQKRLGHEITLALIDIRFQTTTTVPSALRALGKNTSRLLLEGTHWGKASDP